MASQGDIHLLEKSIKEPDVLENFKRIKIYIRDNQLLKTGFTFRTFEIPANLVINFSYKHNLKYVPKDVILTSISNNASATWHFDKFDQDFVFLTVTAACTIRAFFGTYKDESA